MLKKMIQCISVFRIQFLSLIFYLRISNLTCAVSHTFVSNNFSVPLCRSWRLACVCGKRVSTTPWSIAGSKFTRKAALGPSTAVTWPTCSGLSPMPVSRWDCTKWAFGPTALHFAWSASWELLGKGKRKELLSNLVLLLFNKMFFYTIGGTNHKSFEKILFRFIKVCGYKTKKSGTFQLFVFNV